MSEKNGNLARVRELSALVDRPGHAHRRVANDVEATWALPSLKGRLVELSGDGASASLTMAFRLVRDAQVRREPVAWVTTAEHSFYPPDAAASGVDLTSLVVVRVPQATDLARAADHLLRSGFFALAVLDIPEGAQVSMPLQSRLLGLAQKHDAAVLCITQKSKATPSLSSLVSLRVDTRLVHHQRGSFSCELQAIKDKRNAPGWSVREVCRGPAGMR